MSISVKLPVVGKITGAAKDLASQAMAPVTDRIDATKSFLKPKNLVRQAGKLSGISSLSPAIGAAKLFIPQITKSGQSSNPVVKKASGNSSNPMANFIRSFTGNGQEQIKLLTQISDTGGKHGKYLDSISKALATHTLLLQAIKDGVGEMNFNTANLASNAARDRLDKARNKLMLIEQGMEAAKAANDQKKILQEVADAVVESNKKDDGGFLSKIFGGTFLGNIAGSIFKSVIKSITGVFGLLSGLVKMVGPALGGIVRIAGKLGIGKLAKGAGLASLALTGYEGYKAYENRNALAERYNVKNKGAAVAGKVLGGADKGGLSNAASNALQYGANGAMIGSLFGPIGTLVGGLIGAIFGAITGYFGAEKIAKMLDKYVIPFFEGIYKGFKKGLGAIVDFAKYLGDKAKDAYESLSNLSFDNVSKFVSDGFNNFFQSVFGIFDNVILSMKQFMYDTLASLGSVGKAVADSLFGDEVKKTNVPAPSGLGQAETVNGITTTWKMQDGAAIPVMTKNTENAEMVKSTQIMADKSQLAKSTPVASQAPVIIDAKQTHNITNNGGTTTLIAPRVTRNTESTFRN